MKRSPSEEGISGKGTSRVSGAHTSALPHRMAPSGPEIAKYSTNTTNCSTHGASKVLFRIAIGCL
eukprot:scaffold489_cov259-Pinguiococcus_pyrenoidosus.AAC.21